MRPPVALVTIAALAAATMLVFRADTALASSANVGIMPDPRISAWNASQVSIDIYAENVVTTTMCAIDPNDPESPTAPCGLGAYSFTVGWDSGVLSYVALTGVSTIGSRAASCLPATVGASSATLQCVSLGASPLGPEGSVKLGTLKLAPAAAVINTDSTLDIVSAQLTDIAGQQFPATLLDGTIQFRVCANVVGLNPGGVDFSDALAILSYFGQTSPPVDAKYNPVNNTTKIDFADVLFALQEFGQNCAYP